MVLRCVLPDTKPEEWTVANDAWAYLRDRYSHADVETYEVPHPDGRAPERARRSLAITVFSTDPRGPTTHPAPSRRMLSAAH